MEDYQDKKVKDLDPSERADLWYQILAEYQKTQETKTAFLPVILKVEMLAGQIEALKSEIVALDQILDKRLSKTIAMDIIETMARRFANQQGLIDSLTARVKQLEEMHYHAHRHES